MHRPVMSREHITLIGLGLEVTLYLHVQHSVPTVQAVYLTPGGGCRWHAVISIDKRLEPEGHSAILAAWAASREIKLAIVVDKDIDIFNPEKVEWAVATRVQATKDVLIAPAFRGSYLEPSSMEGVSDVMGIDATVPLGTLEDRFTQTYIPGEQEISLKDYLSEEDLQRLSRMRAEQL